MIIVAGLKGCYRCGMVTNYMKTNNIEFEYKILEELPQEQYDMIMEDAENKGIKNFPLFFKDEDDFEYAIVSTQKEVIGS